MKIILAIFLSCLFLLGCSRKENFVFSDGATMQVQHRNGDALRGIRLAMKGSGDDWRFDAKTGKMSDEADGRVRIVLYDVQADFGSKGSEHKDHMEFTFRKIGSKDSITTNPAQFTIAAADLAVPAQVSTNGTGSGNESIIVHLQFSADKADEFRKFTREHINQQIQLLVGSKVVAEPYLRSEISSGQADITVSSVDQAQAVADSLNKR
jgi:hypothetical protein